MKQGTSIKILIKAGCVKRGTAGHATKFCGTAEPGQTGIYLYPLAGSLKDWHVVGFGAWDVPLHKSQFAALEQAKREPSTGRDGSYYDTIPQDGSSE